MSIVIDINSDLGEGLGQWSMTDDVALLDIVSSANVACAFHAGDPSIMRQMCAEAARRGVSVGAHVSYPDLAGFGRRFMDIDPGELRDAVTYQIGALAAFAAAAGTYVSYVKPHGALYNTIVDHEVQARAVVEGVVDGLLTASDGTDIPIVAESLCVHGDTPGAVQIATAVRAALGSAGVTVQSFMR